MSMLLQAFKTAQFDPKCGYVTTQARICTTGSVMMSAMCKESLISFVGNFTNQTVMIRNILRNGVKNIAVSYLCVTKELSRVLILLAPSAQIDIQSL